MRIGIAAEHANSVSPTGVEHYCQQLIYALAKLDSQNQYTLYLRTEPQPWIRELPANFRFQVIPLRIAWTQVGISWQVLRTRPDALLVPSFALPLVSPKNSVVTIHDLAWLIFPDSQGGNQRLWLTFTHRLACRFAKRMIAVSEQTKRDLVERLGVGGEKITVIHHGFSKEAEQAGLQATASDAQRLAEAEKIRILPRPFLLCLGTLQPRKNHIKLIDAFLEAKRRSGLPHKLVIAGRKGWWCEELLDKMKKSPDVIYFDYVVDRFALLRNAAALVVPSIYEGFGLSILDAFAEDVPVACSNLSSLPEVAGDAAALFDPSDVDSMSAALAKILTDAGYASMLAERGRQRLKDFTWEACARKTLETLQSKN